ncbi:MAG TPA: TonB-dependent receptor [Bacteroidales bacterium]|nr:TonB-dependent receptor [Bacteroidales bacterium]
MKKRKSVLVILLILSIASGFAQKGTIKGRIYNAKTNEPLEFCTIIVQGTTIGSTSDLDGNYIFTGINPGFYRLVTSSVGFEPSVSPEIQVTGNQVVFVDMAVTEKSQELREVVVNQPLTLRKLASPVSLLTIGVQDIEKSAGVNRDVSKVLQSLPGVGSTSPQRNDLIVRGGGPSENVFYLDGVEIPVINHFATQGSSGGTVGVINPDFVREINFYSGAFPANRNNALSSVMDIQQRDGGTDRIHASATFGASDAGVTLDGPLSKTSTFIVSARQSYLQYLFKAIGLPFLPTYTDFQLKTKFRFGIHNELTILGIGAIDDMTLNKGISNPTESQNYILAYLPIYKQWNYTVGAVYKHFSEHYNDTWVLSRNMLRNGSFKYLDNDESKPKTQNYLSDEAENKLRFERNYPDLPIKLLVGAGLKYAHYTNETYRQVLIAGTPTDLNYQTNLNLLGYQAFLQASDTYLDESLRLSFGLNLSGNNYNKNMANPLRQLSPRISASYALTEQWSLNANVGRYVMQPSYTSLGFRDVSGTLVNQNENVTFTGSNQAVLGLEYKPSVKLRFTLEGFYKAYDHYAMSVAEGISMASKGTEYGQVGDEQIVTNGKGRAYGVELLAKVWELNGLNVSSTLTLFKSEFTNAAGTYLPSSWDVGRLFNLQASYKFGKSWNLAGRWHYSGGAPYTPIDEALSSEKAVWDSRHLPYLDYSRYNSERLALSHMLDLRLDKEFYFKKWMLDLYMDVQNVYAYKNESAPIYTNLDPNGSPLIDSADPNRYALRQIPNFGGTVLPTIGIMVKF